MTVFPEPQFLEILKDKFSNEIEQNNLEIKLIKLNNYDVIIFIVKLGKNKINSTVKDTNIVALFNADNDCYDIIIKNDTLEELFTKIKKTIFDLCLVK